MDRRTDRSAGKDGSRRRSAGHSGSPGATSPSGERVAFGSGSLRASNYSVKDLEARSSSRKRGESSGSKTRVPAAGADEESRGSSKDTKVNWKKYVTLNPPNLVKFNIVESDLQRIKPLDGGKSAAGSDDFLEADDAKAESYIEILNKSDHYILFKVKTTNIQNYVVRPNADIIPSDYSMKVRVVTQYSLSHCRMIVNDKFLVQMALVDFESIPGWAREKITSDQLGLEEIQMIWDQIDKK